MTTKSPMTVETTTEQLALAEWVVKNRDELQALISLARSELFASSSRNHGTKAGEWARADGESAGERARELAQLLRDCHAVTYTRASETLMPWTQADGTSGLIAEGDVRALVAHIEATS